MTDNGLGFSLVFSGPLLFLRIALNIVAEESREGD
jgi:hypothetical protein